MKPDRKPDSRVFLIAQELEFVRILAGNDPKARHKALKGLNKWLLRRLQTIPFTEEDFQKIWKGLFYCMWLSDKPLIQEECAEKISKLVHFPDLDTSLSFFKAGLFILSQEWTGIDQLRLDKFLMLVRRLLREMFRVLQNNSFKEKNIQMLNEVFSDTILNKANNTPTGLFMHFNEVFMEELAKVTQGKIHVKSVVHLLRPFIQCLAKSNDGREVRHIRKFVFNYLIRQSDVGLDYQERYEAWKQQGFPGSINSMQKVKVDKDEESEESGTEGKQASLEDKTDKPLDPRAGRIDVELPQIPFKARDVANALLEWKFDKNSSTLSRNAISVLAKQFNMLASGVYPLGIKKIDVKDKNEDISVRKAANRLIKLDQKLLGKERKRKRDKENNEKAVVENKRIKIEIKKEDSKNKKKSSHKKQKDVLNGESSTHVKLSKNKDLSEKDIDEKAKTKKINEGGSSTLLDKNQIGCNTTKDNEKRNKSKTENTVSDTVRSKTKKTISRSLTVVDNNKVNTNIVKAKDKLKNKKDKKLNKKKKGDQKNIECIIERNSGTWVVYKVDSPTAKQQSSNIDNNSTPVKTSKRAKSDFNESNFTSKEKSSPSKSPNSGFMESSIMDVSPKAGLSPVKLFESPPEKKEVFPGNRWDEPLQEGEYEICIPSKRYIGKMKKQAKNKNKSVHELINTTLEKIKGKSRLSLDSRLANNPFSKPSSGKKVKINTKLNKSQEIHEHIRNVKSSPAIPYDSTRKPSKPLLKPTAMSTPINPFYKKQLSIF